MITAAAISKGGGYGSGHLVYPDYKDEEELIEGQWQGQAAKRLGAEGLVELQGFDWARVGLHPITGEKLRQRVLSLDDSRSRNLYDFTISAPKSVSVLSELTGDERLFVAHKQAVAAALASWSFSLRPGTSKPQASRTF